MTINLDANEWNRDWTKPRWRDAAQWLERIRSIRTAAERAQLEQEIAAIEDELKRAGLLEMLELYAIEPGR